MKQRKQKQNNDEFIYIVFRETNLLLVKKNPTNILDNSSIAVNNLCHLD